MPRDIYVDSNPDAASDSNSGLSPKRAKLTLQGVLAMGLKPGDRVHTRMGSTWTTPVVAPVNGVTFDTYTLGTERNAAPAISLPRGKPNGVAFTLQGSDNEIRGWDVFDADTGVKVEAGAKVGSTYVSYSGNRLNNLRVQNFGLGYDIRGSKTEIRDCAAFGGRMLRNTAVTYAGAQAFTLWKEPNYPHTGTRIDHCHVEDAYAYTPASKQPDGAALEIFGGIEDARVTWMTVLNAATFCEIGATPDRHETVRGLAFQHCLIVHPNGRVLFVNDKGGAFSVDIEGLRFDLCTLIADDDAASPFYIGAGHGDVSQKLSVTDSIVVGAAQLYNAGAGTDIGTVSRAGNLYWRTSGSSVGVPLINGDQYGDPHFYNASGADYRLSYGDTRAAVLGALGAGPNPLVALTETRVHRPWVSVGSYVTLTQIPYRFREAGMRITVTSLRRVYELQEDMNTWLRCD